MPNIHVLRTELDRTISGLRESVRDKGVVPTARRVAAVAAGQVAFPMTRVVRRDERFGFLGEELPYTFLRYNNAFLNERAVEISIARWFLSHRRGRVLEVGNVLAHYGFRAHAVVDKYEVVPGVLNADVVDYRPAEPFDSVVAISTLEHVGWDESPREPDKVFRAIENVRNCAAPEGRVLVTMPIGHNQALDAGLRDGRVAFPRESWLVRDSRRNEWRETTADEALTKRYGHPYTGANGLYVGMVL
ncbi:class I SAM-dependent methyltransferase [Saccharothrix syringae]|uniref:Class I SAM-dependent methyltransferase n=1 Tax=Saccharothrix syringae TaxID=103733 RepID=A0A5Q0GQD2_SACSY|nr:hypothetical protein [Saccharothrix syringae]QFZ16158.1 hypothetical protein EKG83_00610 [Saccharothrix syringae]